MTDEEKIVQAARNYATGTALTDFKNGIHWRDENPSPEVLALVSALERLLAVTEQIPMPQGELSNELGLVSEQCFQALAALEVK